MPSANAGPARRGRLPRFRGQLEQLESRTVLSATIGVMAIDVDANSVTVIAIWESRPPMSELPAFQNMNARGSAPWESMPAHGYLGGPVRGPATDAYGRLPLGLSGGGYVAEGGASNVGDGFAETGNVGTRDTTPNDLPQRIQASNNDGPKGAPAPSGAGGAPTSPTYRFLRETASAADYFSSLSTVPSAVESSTESARTSLTTQDAAFGSYGRDSLLLAADADSRTGAKLGDGLDEPFKANDKESKLEASPSDSLVEELVGTSLDALQRERAAIDEVLSELHDVKLPPAQADHNAASQSQPKIDAADEAGSDSFAADRQTSAQAANDQAEGGMVLLEPSGDANSSAYDLAAAYFTGLTDDAAGPLGVEASRRHVPGDRRRHQRIAANQPRESAHRPACRGGSTERLGRECPGEEERAAQLVSSCRGPDRRLLDQLKFAGQRRQRAAADIDLELARLEHALLLVVVERRVNRSAARIR